MLARCTASRRSLSPGYFALSGVWTDHEQGPPRVRRRLESTTNDQDVYLVMGGTGTVTSTRGDGMAPNTINVVASPALHDIALHVDDRGHNGDDVLARR